MAEQHDNQPSADAPAGKFQFRLRTLLIVTSVAAVVFALISAFGIPAAVTLAFVGVSWLILISSQSHRKAVFNLGLSYALLWLLIGLLTPAVTSSRGPSRRSNCQNQLRQIGLALQDYHTAHGTYPPAYIADANGKPMHSWRVLLLPYLDGGTVYNQYRFDEPWNGPNNSRLHGIEIPLYRCPSDMGPPNRTSYVLVTGVGTAFEQDKAINLGQITDGLDNTILVIEAPGAGVHWMEPRDFNLTKAAVKANTQANSPLPSGHHQGFNACFADLHVQMLPQDLQWRRFHEVCTICGGEPILAGELP